MTTNLAVQNDFGTEQSAFAPLRPYESVTKAKKDMPALMSAARTIKTADYASLEYKLAVVDLLKITKAIRQNAFRHMYGYYGVEEFSFKDISREEMWNEVNAAVIRAANNFNLEKAPQDPIEFCRVFFKYVGVYASNDPKRFIETMNGVSKTYTDPLLLMKKRGLDLWESDDVALIQTISDVKRRHACYRESSDDSLYRSCAKTLAKMRKVFNNPHENSLSVPEIRNEDVYREADEKTDVELAIIESLETAAQTNERLKKTLFLKRTISEEEKKLALILKFDAMKTHQIKEKYGFSNYRLSMLIDDIEKRPEVYFLQEDIDRITRVKEQIDSFRSNKGKISSLKERKILLAAINGEEIHFPELPTKKTSRKEEEHIYLQLLRPNFFDFEDDEDEEEYPGL